MMVAPKIFVAGASARSLFHRRLISVLRDKGADTWLYEWSSPQDPLSTEVLQALYQRPITLITMSDADIMPDTLTRIIRIGKTISIFNPTRLVLPLPTEHINADRLKNIFPFATSLVVQPTRFATDAINHALTFTALQPHSPIEESALETRLLIGQALISRHRFEEAVGWLLPLVITQAPLYGAQSALAYCYARLEQWEACVEMSKSAFEQAHEHTTSSYCLGLGLNALGRYEAAANAFRRALSTNKQHSAAWVGLGIALIHIGLYSQALQAFEQGLRVSTANEWAYEDSASFAEAQFYITKCIELMKDNDPSSA